MNRSRPACTVGLIYVHAIVEIVRFDRFPVKNLTLLLSTGVDLSKTLGQTKILGGNGVKNC